MCVCALLSKPVQLCLLKARVLAPLLSSTSAHRAFPSNTARCSGVLPLGSTLSRSHCKTNQFHRQSIGMLSTSGSLSAASSSASLPSQTSQCSGQRSLTSREVGAVLLDRLLSRFAPDNISLSVATECILFSAHLASFGWVELYVIEMGGAS